MYEVGMFKNLKIKEKLEALSPKLRWLSFSKNQRNNREFLDAITTGEELKTISDEQRLEAMVRQQLMNEFPNIENSASYELLVDAVIHNIKSKQLQAIDDAEISE